MGLLIYAIWNYLHRSIDLGAMNLVAQETSKVRWPKAISMYDQKCCLSNVLPAASASASYL